MLVYSTGALWQCASSSQRRGNGPMSTFLSHAWFSCIPSRQTWSECGGYHFCRINRCCEKKMYSSVMKRDRRMPPFFSTEWPVSRDEQTGLRFTMGSQPRIESFVPFILESRLEELCAWSMESQDLAVLSPLAPLLCHGVYVLFGTA